MKKYFISLDRTPERTKRFLDSNSHIKDFERSPGLDGKLLDRDDIINKGLLGQDCNFTAGAVGSGLAHALLWAKVVSSGKPAHVFEDDAFLCHNFEQESDRIIKGLPEDWEIILWGNNYDSIVEFELLPGLTQCFASFNQDTVRQNIHTFRTIDVTSVPFRLSQTFGICGYAISAYGASRLIECCFPMTSIDVTYPGLGGRVLTSTSIDHLMNIYYANIKSYTAFPPLCLTDNDSTKSLNI